jgi:transcriptional regulator with XRE-family HTH domain
MERSEDLKSQAALARRTGIAQSTIGRLVRGEVNVSAANLRKLAEAFGISVDVLYVSTEEFGRFLHTTEPRLELVSNIEGPFIAYRPKNVRIVWVCGTCQGGFPDRVWDGDLPETAQEYAEIADVNEKAIICRVAGDSMSPKYEPGSYVLVEPEEAIEIEDDVLVRLHSGETLLKRLLSRRGGVRLGSYNDREPVITFREDEVKWMYWVSQQVPARKIRQRADLQTTL